MTSFYNNNIYQVFKPYSDRVSTILAIDYTFGLQGASCSHNILLYYSVDKTKMTISFIGIILKEIKEETYYNNGQNSLRPK